MSGSRIPGFVDFDDSAFEKSQKANGKILTDVNVSSLSSKVESERSFRYPDKKRQAMNNSMTGLPHAIPKLCGINTPLINYKNDISVQEFQINSGLNEGRDESFKTNFI